MNNNQNMHRNPFLRDNYQGSYRTSYSNKEHSPQNKYRFSKRNNENSNKNNYYNNLNKRRYNNNNEINNVNVFNKEKQTFEVKGEDFPSLSGRDYKKTDQKGVMNYSEKLQTINNENKKTIPTPKKKFVSLVNLRKKKKNFDEEEFESDEEIHNQIENEYNSMDEELEEFYENKKYETNEEFRRENEDYDY